MKKKTWLSLLILIGSFIFLTSCQIMHSQMEPIVVYTASPDCIGHLPSAFVPLSPEEQELDWSKELIIGDVFAKEGDFYRAITSYKRALILLPPEAIERRLQIDYDIILCYYLGNKYTEAIQTFEESELINANPLFPGFNNLLLMLHDAYLQTQQEEKAQSVFEMINKYSPETAQDLSILTKLKEGQLAEAQAQIECHSRRETLQGDLNLYHVLAKSPSKARTLNAILPGAGYYYLGQKKAAMTSFVINALFATAAYQFFHRGYIAAGLITTSLEMGWYLGGINGAGLEAEEFNNYLYSGIVRGTMIKHDFFPVLMFETAF